MEVLEYQLQIALSMIGRKEVPLVVPSHTRVFLHSAPQCKMS